MRSMHSAYVEGDPLTMYRVQEQVPAGMFGPSPAPDVFRACSRGRWLGDFETVRAAEHACEQHWRQR